MTHAVPLIKRYFPMLPFSFLAPSSMLAMAINTPNKTFFLKKYRNAVLDARRFNERSS